MSPNDINERVAALEPQVEGHEKDIGELREFKEFMIKELTALKGSINLLAWKVSVITGFILVAFSQFAPWLFKKLLP